MDREELSKIGFNDSLTGDPRKVMVQTEVVGRGPVAIRTRVLHHGVIQSSEKQPLAETDDIEQIRTAARIQHERILAHAKGTP